MAERKKKRKPWVRLPIRIGPWTGPGSSGEGEPWIEGDAVRIGPWTGPTGSGIASLYKSASDRMTNAAALRQAYRQMERQPVIVAPGVEPQPDPAYAIKRMTPDLVMPETADPWARQVIAGPERFNALNRPMVMRKDVIPITPWSEQPLSELEAPQADFSTALTPWAQQPLSELQAASPDFSFITPWSQQPLSELQAMGVPPQLQPVQGQTELAYPTAAPEMPVPTDAWGYPVDPQQLVADVLSGKKANPPNPMQAAIDSAPKNGLPQTDATPVAAVGHGGGGVGGWLQQAMPETYGLFAGEKSPEAARAAARVAASGGAPANPMQAAVDAAPAKNIVDTPDEFAEKWFPNVKITNEQPKKQLTVGDVGTAISDLWNNTGTDATAKPGGARPATAPATPATATPGGAANPLQAAVDAAGPPGTATAHPAVATTAPVAATPGDDLATALQEYRELFKGFDITPANPAQEKADREAERAGERTKQLAMLAFAGGITKGAGPGWEGIGEGFTNAATAYDKGFERYQEALQDSANRYDTRADREMELEKAIRTGAFTLATERRKTAREEAETRRKENIANITKQMEMEQKLIFPERKEGDMPLTPEQEEAMERRKRDFLRRYQIAIGMNEPVRQGRNVSG